MLPIVPIAGKRIRFYKPARYVEETKHKLIYESNELGCNFAFPCDAAGRPEWNQFTEKDRENYRFCVNRDNRHKFEIFEKVQDYTDGGDVSAQGLCDCGATIRLWDYYCGCCVCPICGAWWRKDGQGIASLAVLASSEYSNNPDMPYYTPANYPKPISYPYGYEQR